MNKELNCAKTGEMFARYGRVHIPSFLTPASAISVHRCLEQKTHYVLTVYSGDGECDVWECEAAALDKNQAERLVAALHESARNGFQFKHETHRLIGDGELYTDPSHYRAAIACFLNGETFLDFAREVTGIPEIALAVAQANAMRLIIFSPLMTIHFLNANAWSLLSST